MASLYDLYRNPEPWDQNLPPDLIPPIMHLRKTFDENHFTYGQVTEKLCYWQLHPGTPDDEINDHLKPLQHLKGIAGAPATQRFVGLLKTNTAPALFKAFFYLYLDGVATLASSIFLQLVPVGKANEPRLGIPHLEWAESQTKNMIRGKIRVVEGWIRDVCDKQPPYDPNENFEEHIFWRKWEAPKLLLMKPSRHFPYDPARIWDRIDAERSQSLLQVLAEHYVIHIEGRLESIAGQAALELAKQPYVASATEVSSPENQAVRTAPLTNKPSTTKRELRRAATEAKYKSWQTEYRSLRKSRPDESDVWYSQKISRMQIAHGSSPSTIRKHMTRK